MLQVPQLSIFVHHSRGDGGGTCFHGDMLLVKEIVESLLVATYLNSDSIVIKKQVEAGLNLYSMSNKCRLQMTGSNLRAQ